MRVGKTMLWWFQCYLTGSFQKVVVEDCCLAPWHRCYGVCRDLSCPPSNIYMKPLEEINQECEVQCHQYTEETQLYITLSVEPGGSVKVLNRYLEMIMGWVRANELKLSPAQVEVLFVSDKAAQGLRGSAYPGTGCTFPKGNRCAAWVR